MKLKVVEEYRNARGEHYPKGRTIDVTEEQGRWLMADAPGCFQVVKPRGRRKAVKEPPENKMVEGAEDK